MSTNRPIHDSKTRSLLLDVLPQEIKKEIYSYCSPTELSMFAPTAKQAAEETFFLRLQLAALNAEPESYKQIDETKLAAIAMLKKHPELLFRSGERVIKDHFGREIKASPYRLLLGTGDVWALKQIHETIIPRIGHGAAEVEVQFRAQFPDYIGPWPFDTTTPEEALYDKRNKEQIAKVKALLKIVVEKITADPCKNGEASKVETTQAIADLCKIFTPKKGEVITTGLHFPLGILKKIGKVYDIQFTPWINEQLAFFSRTVIGFAEAALTTVDGQCVKNGLSTLNMEKGPDRRDGLFCRHPKGIPEDKTENKAVGKTEAKTADKPQDKSRPPLVDKLGRAMFVDPFDGYSCFISSIPGSFDWYNKNGLGLRGDGVFGCGAWVANLWRAKAEAYGSYYAAVPREINTRSRSA